MATITKTMPRKQTASLSSQAYVDVVSYLLEKNEVSAGTTELPLDLDAPGQIVVTVTK